MTDIRNVLIIGQGPIKNAPALHGKDIGYHWVNSPPDAISVDYSTLSDGWVKIVNPPIWKQSGEAGWIKWARVVGEGGTEEQYLLTRSQDGNMTIKRIK